MIRIALALCLWLTVSADCYADKSWNTSFMEFCLAWPKDCAPPKDKRRKVIWNNKTWGQMLEVNRAVNREITYMSDKVHYGYNELWTYPVDGFGDCEDIALEKRRRLIALGFPPRALQLRLVRLHKDDVDLHLYLVVQTDIGPQALDTNRGRPTALRHRKDYEEIAIQDPDNPANFKITEKSRK
jgi:predicted transglutaminase-like cysteine proteinase